MSEKALVLGNQALARGAWEAGVTVAVAYPGTPSTEITESIAAYGEIHAQWAPNEKVALEYAMGAAIAGARTLVCFKHVGLNVAADPLFTAAYTGINAGLVIVVADDPGMHSSQNEQDSRYYARSAHVPMLEPADSQEAIDFMNAAYEISERYNTPVFIRTTTRISHSRSVAKLSGRRQAPPVPYKKDAARFVMLPGNARRRHIEVEKRDNLLARDANEMAVNRVEPGDASLGIIASGAAYQYAREAACKASMLKLGMVHPLPMDLIRRFAESVDRLVVVEELEPVIEEQIKAAGIDCEGKALFSRQGELSTAVIAGALGLPAPESPAMDALVVRPPVMCPGCPHRPAYHVINKLKLTVMGDIGCYTLGALPPVSAMDACLCMGASIPMAHGMQRALGGEAAKKVVAVIGDSTFFHSGITGLVDMVYNGGAGTVLILDNSTTGMTGHQDHPGTGKTLKKEIAQAVDLEALVKACGVRYVRSVDPFDMKALETALKEETERDDVSVIIVRRSCALLPGQRHGIFHVDADACRRCKRCLTLGCPAIEKTAEHPFVNPALCSGCGLCAGVCPFGAIERKGA
ncbi:MAG: indolepyruvate ferredoxin oxidoreductase subunit alpha [Christensenellales bacterium]|jgi:indolepyruvate ferredoxin oxidoreductase alpha subunit